jgi:hypothetical protein
MNDEILSLGFWWRVKPQGEGERPFPKEEA